MKSPHKIGIPPGMRVLYIERHPSEDFVVAGVSYKNFGAGHYRLWIHTNDRILGTYIALHDNGKIERVTVRDNEGDEIVLIKPAD